MGLPAGVAVAATVGGAVVAGVAPVPFGSRSLAIDPAPSALPLDTRTQPAAAAASRTLLGTTSRDRELSERKTTAKPSTSPTTQANPWTCAVTSCHGSMVSGFGARNSPGGIGSTYHRGDDFAVPWGTPLHAMHTGTVVSAGWVPGLGVHISIDYGDGVESVYGHLSQEIVGPGQRVQRGQLVGYSGDTGVSTGPHLHLEIHLHGVAIDPAPWLRARGVF